MRDILEGVRLWHVTVLMVAMFALGGGAGYWMAGPSERPRGIGPTGCTIEYTSSSSAVLRCGEVQ